MPDSPAPEYALELFVAGDSPRGALALRNLQALCAQHLAGRHTLAVVDLHRDPARAEADGVIGLPMLLKRRPGLVRRLVGDLSDRDRVLKVLGVA